MHYRDWWLMGLAGVACADAGEPPIVPPRLGALDPEVALAVRSAEERQRAAPKDAVAAFELALVLDANELDEPAEAAWRRAAELAPADARVWYHLARVRERRGSTAESIEALGRCLALAGDYAPAHNRLGRLQLEAGQLAEAETSFLRARELDPGSPAPPMGLARVALLRNEPGLAIERLEPLARRLPSEPYVHGLLARAWAMQGDSTRAAGHLAAEEEAGAPSVRDPWQAEVQRRAVGLRARLERAKARLALGDPSGAWQELEPLAPRANELAVLDVQCQVLAALEKPREVLACIDAAPDALRTSSLLALKRVLALRALGELEAALREVEAEIGRNPAHPNAHALRGGILLDLERFAEAAEALAAAQARNDRSLATALDLARAHGAAGDWGAAMRELERAAEAFPSAPKPWAYRSEFLALEGRAAEARVALAEAEKRGLEPELVARVAARLEEIAAEGRSEEPR